MISVLKGETLTWIVSISIVAKLHVSIKVVKVARVEFVLVQFVFFLLCGILFVSFSPVVFFFFRRGFGFFVVVVDFGLFIFVCIIFVIFAVLFLRLLLLLLLVLDLLVFCVVAFRVVGWAIVVLLCRELCLVVAGAAVTAFLLLVLLLVVGLGLLKPSA